MFPSAQENKTTILNCIGSRTRRRYFALSMASASNSVPDQFTGFFGSLSPVQTAALEEVKSALIADSANGACPLNDHDCLRFLRARRFDVANSMAMLRAFLEWRKNENVDTILDRPESAQRKLIQILCPMYARCPL
jgi:hypothetical protein